MAVIERRVCPMCNLPIWEDATGAERDADPPGFCSPLRCAAWTTVAKFDHGTRQWVPTDAR
jgi:hypothetical protein